MHTSTVQMLALLASLIVYISSFCIQPTKLNGARCSGDLECRSQTCDSTSSTCKPLSFVKENEKCGADYWLVTTAGFHASSRPALGVCQTGLFCNGTKCAKVSNVGEPCHRVLGDCKQSFCYGNTCLRLRTKKVGEACIAEQECVTGATCSQEKKCIVIPTSMCSNTGYCSHTQQECVGGQCFPRTEGSSCFPYFYSYWQTQTICGADMFCDNTTSKCTKLQIKKEGDPCMASYECAQGLGCGSNKKCSVPNVNDCTTTGCAGLSMCVCQGKCVGDPTKSSALLYKYAHSESQTLEPVFVPQLCKELRNIAKDYFDEDLLRITCDTYSNASSAVSNLFLAVFMLIFVFWCQ